MKNLTEMPYGELVIFSRNTSILIRRLCDFGTEEQIKILEEFEQIEKELQNRRGLEAARIEWSNTI